MSQPSRSHNSVHFTMTQKSSSKSTKAKALKPPGLRQLQKEWNTSLQPWVPQPSFKHPAGTRVGAPLFQCRDLTMMLQTVRKGRIAERYHLNKQDLATLPCERRFDIDVGFMTVLYCESQLSALAIRKRAKLGPISPRTPATHPPALVIETYTCPSEVTKPDPEQITWTPSKLSGAVAVKDACRLYCVCATFVHFGAHAAHYIRRLPRRISKICPTTLNWSIWVPSRDAQLPYTAASMHTKNSTHSLVHPDCLSSHLPVFCNVAKRRCSRSQMKSPRQTSAKVGFAFLRRFKNDTPHSFAIRMRIIEQHCQTGSQSIIPSSISVTMTMVAVGIGIHVCFASLLHWLASECYTVWDEF